MSRILVRVGLACVACSVGLITTSVAVSAADGDLDSGWGAGGTAVATPANVTFPIGEARATSLRIGADGKVTAVGVQRFEDLSSTVFTHMVVARFLPNGQLDPTCDGDGVWIDPATNYFTQGDDLEILPDGSFVVLGSQSQVSPIPEIFSLRFDAQCAPDVTYGLGGKVVHPIGIGAQAAATVLQPDGKIVVAGWEYMNVADDQDTRLLAFRIDGDGQIDPGFSPAGSGFHREINHPSQARAVVRSSDGGVRIAGFTRPGANDLGLVVSLDANGQPMSSFGTNGRRVIAQADDLSYHGIDSRTDGRLVVSGRLTTGGTDRLVIQCLLADGSTDTACGPSGVRTHDELDQMVGGDVRVDANGRLVVVGRFEDPVTTTPLHFVGRFANDGLLDTAFANAGYRTGTVTGRLSRVQLQPNGGILAAGIQTPGSNGEFVVIRLDNPVVTTTVAPTTSPTTAPVTPPPTTATSTTTIAVDLLPATGRDRSDLLALVLVVTGVLLVVSIRRRVV